MIIEQTFRLMGPVGMALFSLVLTTGCGETKAPDCVPADHKQVLEVSPAPIPKKRPAKDQDYCQFCVVAKTGYISCQRALGRLGESRADLKVRAKRLACKDAGYTDATCAKAKVMSHYCKGDKIPEGSRSTKNPLDRIIKMKLDQQAKQKAQKGSSNDATTSIPID